MPVFMELLLAMLVFFAIGLVIGRFIWHEDRI